MGDLSCQEESGIRLSMFPPTAGSSGRRVPSTPPTQALAPYGSSRGLCRGLAAGQVSTGPSQSSKQSLWSGFTPLEWTATEPGWIQGQFTPGTVTNPQFAMGIALLALQNNAGPAPAYKYVWWFELVFLQS